MSLHSGAVPRIDRRPRGATGATRAPRHWHDYVGAIATLAVIAASLWQAPVVSLWLLPVYTFDVASAVAFLTRGRPVREERDWKRLVVTYAAAWGLAAFVAAAGAWRPDLIEVTSPPRLRALSYVLVTGAVLWKLYALWYLRRAFSIEPAARELVTGGPYRFARHPIYTGHIVSALGVLIARPTPAFAAWCVVWFVLLWCRARYEEEVLESAFPAYAAYRARVGAFAPRLETSGS